MYAIYFFSLIALAISPASASLSEMSETQENPPCPAAAPFPRIKTILPFLERVPHQDTVTLYDQGTNQYFSWSASWHTSDVSPQCLKLNNSDYVPYIELMDDAGMRHSRSSDRFVSYRLKVLRQSDNVDVSSFYAVFYLRNPILAERLLITEAPLIDDTTVDSFLQVVLSRGQINLPHPYDPSAKYGWTFKWHTTPNEDFFTNHPQSRYNYHISLIDDSGLSLKRSLLTFASYELWVEDKETSESVYPSWNFYLLSPNKLN